MGDLYDKYTAASGGGKTLTQLQTICQYYGWNDGSTTGLAELTNFINHSIQLLATLAPWPWYSHRNGSATFCSGDTQDDDVALTSTRLDRVGVVVRDDKASPLDEITVEEWLHKKKYNDGDGPPNEYAIRKAVSSGDISCEMLVYPDPLVETVLYYTWHAHPLELSAGGDTTDWPTTRLWLLTAAFQMRLSAIDRDIAGIRLREPDFMQLVNRAFGQSKPSYKPILARSPKIGHKWRLEDVEKTITS